MQYISFLRDDCTILPLSFFFVNCFAKQIGLFKVIGLDDGTSVKLARLLAGISAGVLSDRYVRLGEDDYVALSDSLMAQLRRLEAVSQVSSKDDVRISSLQVGLLADLLHKSGFSSVSADSRTAELEASMKEAMQMDISIPAALDASLRDYQEEGFRWMVRLDHWGAGACLADDMGLGKTVQTIAFLLYKAAAGRLRQVRLW